MRHRKYWALVIGVFALCFLIESPPFVFWTHWHDGTAWPVALFAGTVGVMIGLLLLLISMMLFDREESDTNG